MEDYTNSPMLAFEAPLEQSSYIKVIGVGGGGGNAVNHMYKQGIAGVDFIICNTDMKALATSPVPNKIVLGTLGAGNKPERARKAAIEHKDEVREAISRNTQMLFITAGMGGGTGTGAAPVIAEIAKSIELDDEDVKQILVVAVVTMPFSFEGRTRNRQALEGIEKLREHVDSLIIINNDKLCNFKSMKIEEAFSKADDVLLTAVKGIAEIITVNAYVNIDFRDVNTVMEHSGTALMGTGIGHGETRAMDAVKAATESSLLNDHDIRGSKNVLLYFAFAQSESITMEEIQDVTDYLMELTGGEADVIWGEGSDDTCTEGQLKITLIATGFEKNPDADGRKVVVSLDNASAPALVQPQVKEVTPEGYQVMSHPQSAEPAAAAPIVQNQNPQPAQPIAPETPAPPAYQPPVAPQPAPAAPQRNIYTLDDEPSNSATAPQPAPSSGEPFVVNHRPDAQLSQTVKDVATQQVASVPRPSVDSRDFGQGHPYTDTHMSAPSQSVMHVDTLGHEAVATSSAVIDTDVMVAEAPALVEAPVAPAPRVESTVAATTLPHDNFGIPTAQPVPVRIPMPGGREMFPMGGDSASRLERIKAINSMLHNHQEGPQMVESLTTQQIDADVDLNITPRSSDTAIVGKMLGSSGDITSSNSYVFDQVD